MECINLAISEILDKWKPWIVIFLKPINQLVTSGNAGLYSQNKIEEGLHSALGIQHDDIDDV